MTKEEKDKIKEYVAELVKDYGSDSYVRSGLDNEMCDYIDSLCGKYGWEIEADDTHRWVGSDGWYEVQFMLYTGNGSVYINTKSGDQDLEDEWSDSNPQTVSSIRDCYLVSAWDWRYFLGDLLEFFDKNNG